MSWLHSVNQIFLTREEQNIVEAKPEVKQKERISKAKKEEKKNSNPSKAENARKSQSQLSLYRAISISNHLNSFSLRLNIILLSTPFRTLYQRGV